LKNTVEASLAAAPLEKAVPNPETDCSIMANPEAKAVELPAIRKTRPSNREKHFLDMRRLLLVGMN
jgi:hypothetical protein